MSAGRYQLVALMGPPGSGKSHLGRLLGARGLARYVELEPVLVAPFGAGDAFAAHKLEALRFIEDTHRVGLAGGGPPWAIETTGVSDGPMLNRLMREYRTGLVRLDTERELCADRVARRPNGGNLNNSSDSARQFHDFWTREIAPAYRFDLVVTTEDSEAAINAIAGLLA